MEASGNFPKKLHLVAITDLLDGLSRCLFTSETLVETYIARIHEVNHLVRAISQVNPDAIDIARQRDSERRAGRLRGSLHGIPILVKDLFNTTDKLLNTCGSTALLGAKPAYEATVITKLRDAGAIILGKTTTTAWANDRSYGTAPDGWSAVSGQCVGPFHPDQLPGGSSSGSGVAVALGLAPVALGSETGISIIFPAGMNGVVGLKPSTGMTSRRGSCISNVYQDTVGVLAQTTRDAAHVLSVIAGEDQRDPITLSYPSDDLYKVAERPAKRTDFAKFCDGDRLDGMRIVVAREAGRQFEPFFNSIIDPELDKAMQILKSLGATIIDRVTFDEFAETSFKDMMGTEKAQLASFIQCGINKNEYLQDFDEIPSGVRSIDALVKWTRERTDERAHDIGMHTWDGFLARYPRIYEKSAAYKESVGYRQWLGRSITTCLDRHDADVLIIGGVCPSPAAPGGCPIVAVPLGHMQSDHPVSLTQWGMVKQGPGIPYGMQLIGRRYTDAKLIRVAHAWDQATDIRQRGRLYVQPTIELRVGEKMAADR